MISASPTDVTSYNKFRVGTNLSDLYRNWYSSLPDDSNPRTAELAREMRATAGSDRAFVDAVLQKLNREEFYYTLEPPPLGRNPVDRFLFETRRGFCEHYASAFSVLMRSVGIPTRVVLGYQGGEVNPMGGHLIVRQSDAHAWTEIWLDELGWYRIDPTAAVAPERIDIGASDAAFDGIGQAWGLAAPSRLVHQIKLTWDAMNATWNEWILGYGPDAQKSFMEWLGMDNPSWRKMMLTLVSLVIGLVMLISLLLMLRYRPPQKDEAARLYRRFIKKTGLQPQTGETARVFALRVLKSNAAPDEAVNEITDAYMDARYGRGGENARVAAERCGGCYALTGRSRTSVSRNPPAKNSGINTSKSTSVHRSTLPQSRPSPGPEHGRTWWSCCRNQKFTGLLGRNERGKQGPTQTLYAALHTANDDSHDVELSNIGHLQRPGAGADVDQQCEIDSLLRAEAVCRNAVQQRGRENPRNSLSEARGPGPDRQTQDAGHS